MGVSRLDTITHFTGATGAAPGTSDISSGPGGNGFNIPCNSVTTAIVTGTFGGATVTMQFSNDGVNWAAVSAGITSPGVISFQGCAMWVRITITGGSGMAITASTCHCDQG